MDNEESNIPVLIHHARELRNILYSDPYRPKYHFVPPEGEWNDINGTIYWKGRYHLFYLSKTTDPELWEKLEKMEGVDRNMSFWGHSSSADLLHWIHHPPAMLPDYDGSMPKGLFSGDAIEGADVPTFIYHVPSQGTCIAQAEDDMLIKWKPFPENPVIPMDVHKEVIVFDPTAWKEGDTYYALIGNQNKRKGYEGDSSSIFSSQDLVNWEYLGPFYKSDRKWTHLGSDCACADFYPLGDKYMLLMHNHNPYMYTQYYLGSYENHKFIPEQHEVMSSIRMQCVAPETLIDDKKRRIFFAWIQSDNDENKVGWQSLSSLPREFLLADDGKLIQRPVAELEQLRHCHIIEKLTQLEDNKEIRLKNIKGNCIEIKLTADVSDLEEFGIKVLQADDGSEETMISYNSAEKKLVIDFSHSRVGGVRRKRYRKEILEDMGREQEFITTQELPFELKEGENLDLRIFVDMSVIEVFANNSQVLIQNVYPARLESNCVSLMTKGGTAEIKTLEAWDMHWSNAF